MKNISYITLGVFLFILMSCTNRSFDSEKWKEWKYKGSESFLRWDMADDLVGNYDLIGRTKKEIIELLGKPDSEDSTLGFYYDLGPCRRGIDFGSLYLKFEHGRVRHIDKHCS